MFIVERFTMNRASRLNNFILLYSSCNSRALDEIGDGPAPLPSCHAAKDTLMVTNPTIY